PKPNEGSTVQATSPKSYADDVGNGHRIEIRPETQDASVDAYLQHLLAQLKKSWLAFIPDEASNGRAATVTVVLEIEPDGVLLKGDPRIESTSGSAKLDQAAVYAIRYWRQYDRLPPGFQQPRLTVHASFSYNLGTTTKVEIPPKNAHGGVSTRIVGPPVDASGVEILTDTHGVDFGPYVKRMLSRLKTNWYAAMPEQAKMGEKGKVAIILTVLWNGELSPENGQIDYGSGKPELDKAALDAVRNSGPLESLPQAFDGSYVKLRVVFLYNIRPEDAARELGKE
ncbi:MAG: TonB C-terminal domain-containing protein, partial [Candidatus Acidiferrales bacterium]